MSVGADDHRATASARRCGGRCSRSSSLLTAAFLVLFWLANHYVFRELSTITPPARRQRRHAHLRRRVPARARDVRDALPRRRARRLPHARRRLGRRGARPAAAARRAPRRPLDAAALALPRRRRASASSYVLAVYFARWRSSTLTGHWCRRTARWPGIELAVRRRDRDRALAPRLGRPLVDGERDRRLHALRRRPRRRAARHDRPRAELARRSSTRRRSRRGRCRSRRSTRTGCG